MSCSARAGTASGAEAPMSYDTPASELDAIGKVLATDPQRYWKEKLDQRALELRRESEQRPAANSYAAQRIETELANINKTLRTNPDLYWKRDMGKRATELRRQLEGINATNAARGR